MLTESNYIILQLLTGHQDNAEFALAMCPTEPFVLSGGQNISSSVLYFSLSLVIYTNEIMCKERIQNITTSLGLHSLIFVPLI